ncbi:REXO2 (predicted) [Pycnogonum litorale]
MDNTSKLSDVGRDRILWVDMEMTGLDHEKDHIMEVACLITDGDLNILQECVHIILNLPDEVLDNMDEWCKKHHGESGLTKMCRESDIDIGTAESCILSFVTKHTLPGQCPLAGNSIGEDKRFLKKYFPKVDEHLNYRIIDVSSIKEICRRWYPDESKKCPKKELNHRALDDIKESIKELQYYRKSIFK